MTTQQPEGELVIRTMAMPKDTNGSGDIFGGWLISQMDIGSAILAMKTTKRRTATVAIDKMVFVKPVQVGDVVCCYAKVQRIGNTSVTMQVQAWVRNFQSDNSVQVAEGLFTFVALDAQGKPTPIPRDAS
jgi:acyl-CoA thioesterase YciA